MRMIEPILQEMDQEAETTRRVLERVPDDKLAWRPHPKSMSLGQLALHVATNVGNVATMAIQDSVEVPEFSQPEATSSAETVGALAKSVAEARAALEPLTDAQLLDNWSVKRNGDVVMSIPRIGVLRAIMLNHWYHHRGQISVYLRLLDLPVPSVYGPTADEAPPGM